ncbi:hypothetical protein [Massilia sp. DWR3-1-1]|uniref:hypothetical protein n=1 Tax=Massilia sp. DWR3-1-1 TaxID=2804559 RepID=UPI003CE80CA3
MRLPGTRYQEHGWEQVRKLLGQCSLEACAHEMLEAGLGGGLDARLDDYVDATAAALRAGRRLPRATADGNSYGESVLELALGLLFELRARPADWQAFAAAVAGEHARLGPFWRQAGGEAILRKKFNDMYAVLRDKVDADNYVVACGRPCSANRMYAYRMLDTAYADIARLFDSWRQLPDQLAAILGRPVSTVAAPIEVRQMKSIGQCQGAWVIAWSASREAFTGAAGPLHTRSKRFASLKQSPDKIGAMLREIGDYEELSANRDSSWAQDAADAGLWLDDLARVIDESAAAARCGPDRTLAPAQDGAHEAGTGAGSVVVSAPPGYMWQAGQGHDGASRAALAMAAWSMPVRLAVYLKLMGPFDDCYPAEWLDGASGELPTMAQLAAREAVSLPTLRKRRDAAIAALGALAPAGGAGILVNLAQ